MGINLESERILGAIIFRSRLAKGWNGYDAETQNLAVQTWFEILDTEHVPYQFYDELYRRAAAVQSNILQTGKEPPDMSAQLLVACWTGQNGLKAEIKRIEIEGRKPPEENRAADSAEKHFLADDGKIKCHYCFGCGFREVIRGKYKGVIRCLHEENYVLTIRDEIVGGDEGMEIIKVYLAQRGIAFEGNVKEFTNVVRGNF